MSAATDRAQIRYQCELRPNRRSRYFLQHTQGEVKASHMRLEVFVDVLFRGIVRRENRTLNGYLKVSGHGGLRRWDGVLPYGRLL